MTISTDSITKTVDLAAPLDRVWAAISDSARFGAWFGAEFDGPFIAGQAVNGRIAPTTVDPDVAAMQEPYAGARMVLSIDVIDPPHRFVYRWHPGATEWDDAIEAEPTTTVSLTLTEIPGGTRLTIVEDGFDALPADRRGQARTDNEGGWTAQAGLIARYLERQHG